MKKLNLTRGGINKIGAILQKNFNEISELVLHQEIYLAPNTPKHGVNSVELYYEITVDNNVVDNEQLSTILKSYIEQGKILVLDIDGDMQLTVEVIGLRQIDRAIHDIHTYVYLFTLKEENYGTRIYVS